MKRISKKEFDKIMEIHPKKKIRKIQPKKKIIVMQPKKEIRKIQPKSVYLISIQQQIIDVLKKKGKMSRDDLCEEFGFKKKTVTQIIHFPSKQLSRRKYIRTMERYDKRTTIYDNLRKLEKKEIVEKFSQNNGKRGRSITMWKIKGKGSEKKFAKYEN